MIDLMFISETALDSDLESALEELVAQKIRVSKPVAFNAVINNLKVGFFEYILINANDKKLDCYELCLKIKLHFRNQVKVFVYLPETNANEASRFGLINAEVEDKNSIKNLFTKLHSESNKNIEIEENIISLFSPYGGLGLSSICFLLTWTLDYCNKNSLVLETNYNQSLKKFMQVTERPALLAQKQIQTNYDSDWFNGFITANTTAPNTFYLNLFNSLIEQEDYCNKNYRDISEILQDTQQISTNSLINKLKLICKDLEGKSLSLFNEIIQNGSKLTNNFIFDLGKDLHSTLNRQLMHYSKTVVLVLKDSKFLQEEYLAYKNLFDSRSAQNIILVISSLPQNTNYLNKISNDKWLKLLGTIPLIYPYNLEEINDLILEQKRLTKNSQLLAFSKKLLGLCHIKTDNLLEDSPRGILKFLINNY